MRLATAFALLALGTTAAFGQYAGKEDLIRNYVPGETVEDPVGGRPIVLKVGDKIKIGNSDLVYTIGKDPLPIPIDTAITVNGQAAITRPARTQHSVGVYPGTVFSIGGQLRKNDNSFVGGTRSVAGCVFSYDAISNLDFGRRFELGAFLFEPYNRNDGDLYQFSGRYFPNKQVGFQVAYLNGTNGSGNRNASSFSYHVLFDLSALAAGKPSGRQISARVGIGVLNNLSKKYNIDDNTYANRSTFGFSSFVDLSYSLTPRVAIDATEWFIRDRNADINRLGIGVSYKF